MPQKNWTAAHRRKLSAIRTPHKNDPKDFYYDAADAWAALNEKGPLPAALNPEAEMARWGGLMQTRGISWSGSAGRCFSDEFCNPLVALWVSIGGWDFVWELVFAQQPKVVRLADDEAIWYGLRRYLFRASEADYKSIKDKLAPRFQEYVTRCKVDRTSDDYKLRDRLAFVFSRDGSWCDEILRETLKKDGPTAEVAMLTAVTQDPQLALKATRNYLWWQVYFVFDLVESLGRDAAPILLLLKPNRAQDKKRVQQALQIAQAL